METITLEQLLDSRDKRHLLQQELLQKHPQQTLVCLTVVMPGNVKRNRQSLVVAHSAVESLRQSFHPSTDQIIERDLNTGYEAFLLTNSKRLETKKECCRIEDTHPLGRLFDIDVLLPDGTPMTRQELGLSPRRCLLCDNEARYCMRNHTHTQDELWQHITTLIDAYEHRL